ncbi:hypothetical protein CC80DRAFT_442665 [Byssothecium circinans]|uniref:Alb1-domain-containing protein n=1 Tax=Byssothecium circinans TaxID=147558 RepID=A0A6A5TZ88_9PLEO|nr:hypothetical protein CC80DRAFT_442665 [Byssothecium circinans]
MAKTAKIKKKQSTLHSRAARRAVSPTDHSLTKSAPKTRDSVSPAPDASSAKPHVLAARNAGISKSKSKPLKRAQRLRQQKGMERAEENMDKLELKRAKSFGKEKKVKQRAKAWDEVNEAGLSRKKSKKGMVGGDAFEGLDEEEGLRRGQRKWELDEEMEDGDGDAGEVDAKEDAMVPTEVTGEVKEVEVVVPETVPLPVAEEDELL